MERRDFIRRAGRLLMISGMTAGTAYLTFSGKVTFQKDCQRSDLCKRCAKTAYCDKNQDHKMKADGKQ